MAMHQQNSPHSARKAAKMSHHKPKIALKRTEILQCGISNNNTFNGLNIPSPASTPLFQFSNRSNTSPAILQPWALRFHKQLPNVTCYADVYLDTMLSLAENSTMVQVSWRCTCPVPITSVSKLAMRFGTGSQSASSVACPRMDL